MRCSRVGVVPDAVGGSVGPLEPGLDKGCGTEVSVIGNGLGNHGREVHRDVPVQERLAFPDPGALAAPVGDAVGEGNQGDGPDNRQRGQAQKARTREPADQPVGGCAMPSGGCGRCVWGRLGVHGVAGRGVGWSAVRRQGLRVGRDDAGGPVLVAGSFLAGALAFARDMALMRCASRASGDLPGTRWRDRFPPDRFVAA